MGRQIDPEDVKRAAREAARREAARENEIAEALREELEGGK